MKKKVLEYYAEFQLINSIFKFSEKAINSLFSLSSSFIICFVHVYDFHKIKSKVKTLLFECWIEIKMNNVINEIEKEKYKKRCQYSPLLWKRSKNLFSIFSLFTTFKSIEIEFFMKINWSCLSYTFGIDAKICRLSSDEFEFIARYTMFYLLAFFYMFFFFSPLFYVVQLCFFFYSITFISYPTTKPTICL